MCGGSGAGERRTWSAGESTTRPICENGGVTGARPEPQPHQQFTRDDRRSAHGTRQAEIGSQEGQPASNSAEKYTPTPREAEAIAAFTAAYEARKPSARLEIKKTAAGIEIGVDHKDALTGQLVLMQALGTTDFDFFAGFRNQLLNAGNKGQQPDELGVNFMLSVVKGVEPRDQVEAMLAAQMAATHMATMAFTRRLAHVENIPQADSASNAFNKLTRTFAAQMEALKRYRSTGEQKVTVQHVTVQPGGQAIVGNVSQGKPANDAGQAPPASLLAPPSETPLPAPGGGGVQQRKVRAIP